MGADQAVQNFISPRKKSVCIVYERLRECGGELPELGARKV